MAIGKIADLTENANNITTLFSDSSLAGRVNDEILLSKSDLQILLVVIIAFLAVRVYACVCVLPFA